MQPYEIVPGSMYTNVSHSEWAAVYQGVDAPELLLPWHTTTLNVVRKAINCPGISSLLVPEAGCLDTRLWA